MCSEDSIDQLLTQAHVAIIQAEDSLPLRADPKDIQQALQEQQGMTNAL